MKSYFTEIEKYPLLTAEKERQLAISARAGDADSRELLISSNYGLVLKSSKKYAKSDIYEEIVQQGTCGLIQAVDRFDPDKGCRFSTYAIHWINKEIFSFFKNKNMVRSPPAHDTIKKRADKIVSDYFAIHSENPSIEYITSELNKFNSRNYSADYIESLLQRKSRATVFSLDNLVQDSSISERNLFTKRNNSKFLESLERFVFNQIACLDTDDLTKRILEGKLYFDQTFIELSDTLGLNNKKVAYKFNRGLTLLRGALKKSPQFIDSVDLDKL